MKKFYLLLILALPMRALAQPIIHNCDNYSVGDVLTYVDCDVTGIEPGTGGANHTWDLSWLGAFTIDSLERQYFLPNPSGSPFPLASVVDSESFLGNLLYMKINAGQTSVLGTYDVGFSVNTEYTTPQALSQRPIAYNDSFHTTFTRKSPFPEAITGSGTVDIVADGYGTLILPNGTDSNVLRVVHYISETDTSGGHSYTTPHIDYFWYDDKHVAPLCVMLRDSVPSLFITYEVMYLQKETPGLAVKNVAAQKFPAFNGNLTNNELTIHGNFEQNHIYELAVYNLTGQKVYNTEFNGTSEMQHFNINSQLSTGIYLVNVVDKNNRNEGMIKLVKQ